MGNIKTIDLWTEAFANHYECFNGAFIDGFENNVSSPYNKYKIVKNCNCIISNNWNLAIGNKHHAIIFYQNTQPVRLVVCCHDTDVDKLIKNATQQKIGNQTLSQIFKQHNIQHSEIDLKEKPIYNEYNSYKEIDTGSCDRFSLMKSMLSGNYTEDDTKLGHFDSTTYFYIQDLSVTYNLTTDRESFEIDHEGGFLNDLKTRIIILQKKFSGN